MTTLNRVVMAAAVVLVGGVCAQAQTRGIDPGSFSSTVRDAAGSPVAGAIVSAVGRRTVSGTTDAAGSCRLTGLPPGEYLIRVHRLGYAPPNSVVVRVTPGAEASRAFVLGGQASSPSARFPTEPDILAAGFVGAPIGTVGREDSASTGDTAHDHDETAWRLRHLRRSVLKDSVEQVVLEDDAADMDDGGISAFFGRAATVSGKAAASLFTDFPLNGQLNLLTTSTFDERALPLSESVARGLAYLSLGAAAGDHGDWAVEAAMTQGDVSSWVFAGSYLVRAPAAHQWEIGMTYAAQRYRGVNPASLQAVADGSRNTGGLYAYDRWTISRRAALVYGARYERYGYMDEPLFSPRAELEIAPLDGLRLRASAARRADAPGSGELQTRAISSTWLPMQRTFAPLSGRFTASRTETYDLGLEQDLGAVAALGVRTFFQRGSDQVATIFGLDGVHRSTSDLHHYYTASAGDFVARGWTVSLSRVVAHRVRGSIGYTVTTAEWEPSIESASLATWAPGALRSGSERLHDITTSVETEIPQTSTRLFAFYRVNTGYAGTLPEADQGGALDARFDVQVTQALPFLDFTSAQWEMLLGIRNLFRDIAGDASIYDELLVVRPPKRVVGGLTVRF